MMIDAKLCLHFAEVCLRAAEQEADDPRLPRNASRVGEGVVEGRRQKSSASMKSTPQND